MWLEKRYSGSVTFSVRSRRATSLSDANVPWWWVTLVMSLNRTRFNHFEYITPSYVITTRRPKRPSIDTSGKYAWTMARSDAVLPIVGARNLVQFQDNLGALAVELPPETMARLDAVSAITLGFPHDFMVETAPWLYGDEERIAYENGEPTGAVDHLDDEDDENEDEQLELIAEALP